jgi:gamma-glutamyltranspeptidase/glutathione hydrolase
MLVLLSSYRGKAGLGELARAGVASAETAGSKARGRLLRRVGSAGVLALRSPEIADALLAAGGPVAGGTLTATDLEEAAPSEEAATSTALADGTVVHAPPFVASAGEVEAIVTCDARGGIAALAYAPSREPIPLPGLDLAIGRDAVPVRRGVTRVAPGAALASPFAVAIAVRSGGVAVAIGLAGEADAGGLRAGDLAWLAEGLPLATALADLRSVKGARLVVGALTDGRTARATVIASTSAG